MGVYRNRWDIIADILRVASGNAKKTQIMFQANLSYSVLQKYLAGMTSASLISYEDNTQCYVLTDKGSAFLEAYQEYSKSNRHLAKKLNAVHTQRSFLEKLCSTTKRAP
ncbi:MAG: winged helix-turn-helix domain-containing protein [Candidatus Bathyarchaeota archaeon]|nr:winged helix-turn-helix domain-containing protein [Candidatus Bathyarchaeota archaeon]